MNDQNSAINQQAENEEVQQKKYETILELDELLRPTPEQRQRTAEKIIAIIEEMYGNNTLTKESRDKWVNAWSAYAK